MLSAALFFNILLAQSAPQPATATEPLKGVEAESATDETTATPADELLPKAPPEADETGESSSSAEDAAPAEAIDEVVERQREQLQRFAAGETVPSVRALLAVDLADVEAVRRRVRQLEELEATGADAIRLELLRNWLEVFRPLSVPAQRTFAALGDSRAELWETAARLDGVELGLAAVASALAAEIAKAESGALIGFRPDVAEWASAAELTRGALRRTATETRRAHAALEGRVRELRESAIALRERFLVAALRGDRAELDRLFLETIERQRRLRLAPVELRVSAVDDRIRSLARELPEIAKSVDAVRDVVDARAALGQADTALSEARATLAAARRLSAAFELAQVREALTLLLPVASSSARTEAYPLGLELVGELQTELKLLVESARRYFEEQVEILRGGEAVRWLAPRIALALLLALLTWLAQRRAPRVVSMTVRAVARSRFYRGKVGTLVRWAGLFQAVAPVAVVAFGGYVVLWTMGLDRPEIRFVEIGFRSLVLYWLGRAALVGAARRVSAGRPALIDASQPVLDLLQRSYNRLALVLAIAFMIEEWARTLFALGRLRMVIDLVVVLWVLGWVTHACIAWRGLVAKRLRAELGEESPLRGAAAWMERRRLGAILVPLAILAILFRELRRWVSEVLLEQGVFAYLKARALRRQSASAQQSADEEKLPDEYVSEFPLYPFLGEVEGVTVPRTAELDPILAQIADWKESKRESSLALVGEKGLGKTTLLGLLRPRITGAEVIFTTLTERLLTPAVATAEMAKLFAVTGEPTFEELVAALNEGPERVVLIDDAHLSFLRIVNGYRGFDALVQLVNRTGERIFWLLSFNDFAWSFLNAAHGGRAYFRRVQRMKRWSADELRDLIGRRTKKAGYELEFDEQLLDDERLEGGGIRLVEGAEGFFRLLWESSRGNPRAASWQWLRALTVMGEKRLRVQLFSASKTEALNRANDDVYFALAAIAQHENLDEAELQATLNVDPSFASFALRYLTEYGIVGAKTGSDSRHTLKMRHYWEVVQALRARNLLFREEQA